MAAWTAEAAEAWRLEGKAANNKDPEDELTQ